MKIGPFIQQLVSGAILLLLGKSVTLIAGIYSTVLRMEIRMEETHATTMRLEKETGEHSRQLVDFGHRLKIVEHTN